MYTFELPTTGAISFSEFCIDQSTNREYGFRFSQVTEARANLRAILKETKRTDGFDKDTLKLVKIIEEYLPQLQSVMTCVVHDEIGFKSEPIFTWRSTLSANLLKTSPRLPIPGLHADYAFTLLTYGYALCNLAWSIVNGLGTYEQDRAISDAARKVKDEQLNVAIKFLCKASGIFAYIADTVLPNWEVNRTEVPPGFNKPPELTREVNNALSKMALADAQTLAIRKLLSKSAYESNIAPGPPLPKSHPSPALLAKLHLECGSFYSSARSLVKTIGSSKGSGSVEVISDLRKHLAEAASFHEALGHKWLGVAAGENGGSEKGGEAVGFVAWAKKELEELKSSGQLVSLGKGDKEVRGMKKTKLADEIATLDVFLKHYKKMNDSVHFQPVPSQADLQRLIPTGTAAVATTAYSPPQATFGPDSAEYQRRKQEASEAPAIVEPGLGKPDDLPEQTDTPVGNYAGAGSYF
ncbi:pH-response regulator protein palC [Coprinopsis cinerea okayama7|uniref:pH-response regulator protein palC n=1 Tax=Coprinopsis cinerea (strain Okayama-7 / 130 / ATCC MYA-4618 / FGSC 9003) TaxID=240176 RepID=A8N7A5_COPC7|nr:pH-response regulator protein palC [Coprinopsis cinerea okayama7\|eukprot:XP_001830711.1 pH-response regulator protein palC [Coprinopsis cinerea okayama7\